MKQRTPVHRLRVGDTWTEHGHTRRVTSRPQPRGDGSYTFTTIAPAFTTVRDTRGIEIGAIRVAADGIHHAARLATDGTGYIPVGEYTAYEEAHAALTGRVLVRATRAKTSPVVGYYEPTQVPDSFGSATTHTEYRAHLADGTPAGRLIEWGSLIAPATNVWPTETKARAAIRAAYRHLTEKR